MIRFDVVMDEDRSPGPRVTITPRFIEDPGFVPAFLRSADESTDTGADADADPDDAAPGGEAPAPARESVWASGVEISVERVIPNFDRLPFCYELAQTTGADTEGGRAVINSSIIRVVAAPGVSVRILSESTGGPVIRIDVVRVQDPCCIPALGQPIDVSLLLATNGVPMHRNSVAWFASRDFATLSHAEMGRVTDDSRRADAAAEFVAQARTRMRATRIVTIPQRNGMLFFDNLTQRMLQVEVPTSTRSAAGSANDHRARFGYALFPAVGAGHLAVVLFATPQVRVHQFRYTAFDAGDSLAPPTDVALSAIPDESPFGLLRISSFDSIPLPGSADSGAGSADGSTFSDLLLRDVTVSGWTRADGTRFDVELVPLIDAPPSLAMIAARMAVDLAVARIPFVGDAVDLAEFAYAAATGHDRWGEPVGIVDFTMMGLGAFMPFIGNREARLLGASIMGGYAAYSIGGVASALSEEAPVAGAPE